MVTNQALSEDPSLGGTYVERANEKTFMPNRVNIGDFSGSQEMQQSTDLKPTTSSSASGLWTL